MSIKNGPKKSKPSVAPKGVVAQAQEAVANFFVAPAPVVPAAPAVADLVAQKEQAEKDAQQQIVAQIGPQVQGKDSKLSEPGIADDDNEGLSPEQIAAEKELAAELEKVKKEEADKAAQKAAFEKEIADQAKAEKEAKELADAEALAKQAKEEQEKAAKEKEKADAKLAELQKEKELNQAIADAP